jgi:hypothetical protein
MAGIILIAELVIKKQNLRKTELPNVTQFYPLNPITKGINPNIYSFTKDSSGRCICNDEDFIKVYEEKWLKPRKA